ASTRADVLELTAAAWSEISDLLTGPRVETTVRDRDGNSEGKREFQAGDRLYFKKNSRKLGVMNGETGTLEKIDVTADGKECSFTVRMDNGKEVGFDPRDYAQIDYGYAVTIHKSQGETVDFSSNLVTGMGLNALYVQMTRHRDGMQIVLTEDQIDKMTQNSGIELAPTDRMIAIVEQVRASRPGLEVPEDWNKNFDVCRDWLDKHSGLKLGGREVKDGFESGLEKVQALLYSIRKTEKMNALDFEVEEKEVSRNEKERDRGIGEKVQGISDDRTREVPGPGREHGKEEGSRIPERAREHDGMGMGM
ncbi:MAG: hypothetical protein ACYDBP_14165, partial [Leptospirales bacterium]